MFDMLESYSGFTSEPMVNHQNIRPNIRTGEGRMKYRPWSAYKQGDQKKKVHRKMTKQSRRANRG